MAHPRWPSGQPQIANHAGQWVNSRSVTLRPLSLVALPDIPRIPDGWNQGRSYRGLRQWYIARSVRGWQPKQPVARAEALKTC